MRGAIIFLSALIVAGCGTGTGVSAKATQEEAQKSRRGIGWMDWLLTSRTREQLVTINGFSVISGALSELLSEWPTVGDRSKSVSLAETAGSALAFAPPSKVLAMSGAPDMTAGVHILGPLMTLALAKAEALRLTGNELEKFYAAHDAKLIDIDTAIMAYALAGACVSATQPVPGWPGLDESVYLDWAREKARLLFVANQTYDELMRRAGDSVQQDPQHARRAVQKALLSLTAGEIDALWNEAEKTRSQYETGDMVLNFTGVQGAQWQNGQVGYRLLPTGPEVTVAGADFFGGQGGAIYGGQRTFRVASLIGAEQGESRNVSREQELRQSQGSGADAGVK